MEQLKRVKDMVLFELENRPETRDSDRELIRRVYEDFYGIRNESFAEVIMRDDLPNFESIRRNRAKAQEVRPDLRASEAVQDFRFDKEQIYFGFFGEV